MLNVKAPVVTIAMPGSVFEKVLSNAQEARARDARLIGLTPWMKKKLPTPLMR